MKKTDVLAMIEDQQDPRGIKNWNERFAESTGLKSYGVGLTKLRKLAKGIKKDARLAAQLWKSDVYEARVVSLLIDDPKAMTIEQAESQVEQLDGGHLAHVFSSCDAQLAKTPFVRELADRWIATKDPVRRRCGFGLLYELSKSKKKSAPGEDYFLDHLARMDKTITEEHVDIQMAMGGAIMGIGKRSKTLNRAALEVARKVSPIDFDPDGKCDPCDIVKHLTSDYLVEKLGL